MNSPPPRPSRTRLFPVRSPFGMTPMAVGVCVAFLGWQEYWRSRERNLRKLGLPPVWPKWRLKLYCSLPSRALSRGFGAVSRWTLPSFLRRPVLGTYCWMFSCDMDESVEKDLVEFESLSAFFNRQLKTDVRPISADCLVSPTDGVIFRAGVVENGVIEQVKGLNYRLENFIGGGDLVRQQTCAAGDEKSLMYCVVYLAPGYYHGFHSPTDWTVSLRRHIAGQLLSVREKFVQRVPQLFCRNERVVLSGVWKHGYFSMTAVGATNVGNIHIQNDQLRTNGKGIRSGHVEDRQLRCDRTKGEKIGEFRLGSTIVLIFQTPADFQFCVQPGDHVKYGQSLGYMGK